MRTPEAWSLAVLMRAAIALTLIMIPGRIHAQETPDPPDTAPPPPVEESTAPPTPSLPPPPTSLVVRGLSWDSTAGGIPNGGALIEAQIGFSGLPRVAYHYTLQRGFSVGGLVSLDLGWWSPTQAIRPGLVLGAPVRITLYRDAQWSVGFRGEPGFLFDLKDDLVLGLALPASLTAGLTLEERLIVGLSIDAPAVILIPTGSGPAALAFPILGGPTAELHLTPPFAITFEAKFGPWLSTSGTNLGARVLLGAAYRL